MTELTYRPILLKACWHYDAAESGGLAVQDITLDNIDQVNFTSQFPYNRFQVIDVNLIDNEDDVESLWTATGISKVLRNGGRFGFDAMLPGYPYVLYAPDKNDFIIITRADVRNGVLVNKEIIDHFAEWYCPNKKPRDIDNFDDPDSDMPDIF